MGYRYNPINSSQQLISFEHFTENLSKNESKIYYRQIYNTYRYNSGPIIRLYVRKENRERG